MRRGVCHANVSFLWMRMRRRIVGIGTGYALSADGLWRQHSWGVQRQGILETTQPREKYFGLLLQGSDADSFAYANLAEMPLSHPPNNVIAWMDPVAAG